MKKKTFKRRKKKLTRKARGNSNSENNINNCPICLGKLNDNVATTNCCQKEHSKCLKKLPKNSYEIVGMLWVQGESDSGQKHGPLPSEKYSENLTSLIEKIREHYGIKDMPFLMLGVGSSKIIKSMEEVSKKISNVDKRIGS